MSKTDRYWDPEPKAVHRTASTPTCGDPDARYDWCGVLLCADCYDALWEPRPLVHASSQP
jgi:hypothetical protein